MSGSTSVPPITFGPNGFVSPEESRLVEGLNLDWRAAFGGSLNTDPREPTGQLVTSQAAILGDNYDQQAALYNGVDPAYATGRLQDAIARIYFLTRNPALPTVLSILCTGLGGVVIPANSLITDSSGVLYYNATAITIPSGGSTLAQFTAQLSGPTPIPAVQDVTIYQGTPGWDTVACDGGSVGTNAESRAAFEQRRQETVAANSLGMLPSVLGEVLKVLGVIDAYVTENWTPDVRNVRGYNLKKNSLYVAAAGGLDASVADAIIVRKNPGCDYNGNTTVNVEDTNSSYSPPFPVYPVTFERPIPVSICFEVNIINNPGIPSNATELIAGAINQAFYGLDGGTRARIGSTIFSSRFYAAIAALGPWVQIRNITVGSAGVPDAAFVASITGTVMTVTSVATVTCTAVSTGTEEVTISSPSGTVYPGYNLTPGVGIPVGTQILYQRSGTVGGDGVYVTNNETTWSGALSLIWIISPGQFVFGGLAPPNIVESGTLILSNGTGTGGTGTYNISQNQTIVSEDMLTVAPILTDITVGIDQLPVFGGFDVNVETQIIP